MPLQLKEGAIGRFPETQKYLDRLPTQLHTHEAGAGLQTSLKELAEGLYDLLQALPKVDKQSNDALSKAKQVERDLQGFRNSFRP